MACPTCRRKEFGEDCGARIDEPCPCCGMEIIAEVQDTTINTQEAVSNNEEQGVD